MVPIRLNGSLRRILPTPMERDYLCGSLFYKGPRLYGLCEQQLMNGEHVDKRYRDDDRSVVQNRGEVPEKDSEEHDNDKYTE